MKKIFYNFINHTKTVLIHKKWVFHYCWKFRIPIQGFLHDFSKFHPVEFFESVKYYDGKISPITIAKRKKGYSKAWFHHRGRNPHHYEYWVDSFNIGGIPLDMPFKYKMEMLADYLAAGRTYMKDDFSYKKECEYIKKNILERLPKMHENTKAFLVEAINLFSLYDYADSGNILDYKVIVKSLKEKFK